MPSPYKVLIPVLEELDQHDFVVAVITLPDCVVSIRRGGADLAAAGNATAAPAEEPSRELTLSILRAPRAGLMVLEKNVRRGEKVVTQQQVAVVQVMDKTFSVHSDVDGTIEDLLQAECAFVEYGQPLVAVRSHT